METLNLPDDFRELITHAPNGCWHLGNGANRGYSPISINGDRWLAHRYVATLAYGFIPKGMVIDHLCHNRDPWCEGGETCLHRRCVNPAHLRIVSVGENVLASPLTTAGINARRTTCVWGHPLEGDNLKIRIRRDGRKVRVCLDCTARRSQERTVRRRNAVKAVAA